jgi:hypothetical protein
MSVNGDPQKLWVCVYIEMYVQLRGDANDRLMYAYTNNFPIDGSRVLAARDFAKKGSSEIYIRDGGGTYEENAPLRKKLEDMAAKNPTAPPGKYTVIMNVLRATSEDPTDRTLPNKNEVLGNDSKTVVVQFSTADEAFVEINDPKDGSFFNNLAPTFSWTSSSPVKVSVYEAGQNHRSPQDALTGGNPCLVRKSYGSDDGTIPPDFTGTSLTYPGNAERKLEQDKAYVLQVEAKVSTNRGDIMRPARPVVFRITDDNVGKMLDNFLNSFSGSASATYSALRAEPSSWVAWQAYGNIILDGSMITETDLQTLLNELAGQTDSHLHLSVENR